MPSTSHHYNLSTPSQYSTEPSMLCQYITSIIQQRSDYGRDLTDTSTAFICSNAMWNLLNRRNIQMMSFTYDSILPMVNVIEGHDLWTENILHGQFTAQYSFLHGMSTTRSFAWVVRCRVMKHHSIFHQVMICWIIYNWTIINYMREEQCLRRVMKFSTVL